MLRQRNRRGIFIVLFGLLFLVVMGAAGMAIDMSRIWTMRNELQTSADAGALAGAIQLATPHLPAYVDDSVRVIAGLNRAQYDLVSVDSVETGIWDDTPATFTPGGPLPHNAVRVVVSHGTNKMLMGLFGVAPPRVKARAIAWANAPVTSTTCLRPWSIPYVVLMQKVNLKREALAAGDPKYALPFAGGYNSAANLTRPFTDLDRDVLNDQMTPAERTFSLKLGANKDDNTVDFTDPPPGSTQPGNYQAVRLPRKRSAAGTLNPDGTAPQGGGQNYREAIEGLRCYPIGIGDVLEVETGNMIGPTLAGVEKENAPDEDYVCAKIVGSKNNDPEDNAATHGNCKNDLGGYGVDVKAAFHLCSSGCSGQSEVTVQMLGSFTLKKVYPDADNGTPGWAKAQIVGEFKPVLGTGPVGPGPTTIRRIILVR